MDERVNHVNHFPLYRPWYKWSEWFDPSEDLIMSPFSLYYFYIYRIFVFTIVHNALPRSCSAFTLRWSHQHDQRFLITRFTYVWQRSNERMWHWYNEIISVCLSNIRLRKVFIRNAEIANKYFSCMTVLLDNVRSSNTHSRHARKTLRSKHLQWSCLYAINTNAGSMKRSYSMWVLLKGD